MFFNFFTSLLFLSKPLLIVLLFSKEKYQKTKEFLQRSFQTIKIYTISLLELIIQITDKASASLFYFLQAFHIIKFIFWPFFGKCSTIFFLSKNKFLSEYWLVGLERAIKWRWGFTKRSKFDCTDGDVYKNVWLLSGGTGHKSRNWTHSAGFKRAMEWRRGLT